MQKVRIIGAGLAGSEAAHYLANRNVQVELYEMRPVRQTEAHQSDKFAELVCSNSFKSLSPQTAPGILKKEMQILNSLALQCAELASVSAGEALAVDRELFSQAMTDRLEAQPNITVKREEIQSLSKTDDLTIVATGPLTSEALAGSLAELSGSKHFYFYDAISPIIATNSIDFETAFYANRWEKKTRAINECDTDATPQDPEQKADADYINCPLDKEQYEEFVAALLAAEQIPTKDFERLKVYEGCMPIEEIARRGHESLRYGPMRPVGLWDPRTGKRPYAVVQLRAESKNRNAYNLVGFQTKMRYGEQARVFKMIPGLENAEFLRMGSMHRNAFMNSPEVLNPDLSLKTASNIILAGQITGVEGYMESASIGILAGIFAHAKLQEKAAVIPPEASAMGALLSHLKNVDSPDFQPMGINFGLFNDELYGAKLAKLRELFPKSKKLPKKQKREYIGEAAVENLTNYANLHELN